MTESEIVKEFLTSQHLTKAQSRTICPVCSNQRTKSTEKILSVKLDGDSAVYNCHHCSVHGVVSLGLSTPVVKANGTRVLEPAQLDYLERRGISVEVAESCGLIAGNVYIKSRRKEALCFGFPYTNVDGTTAVKWRDGAKNFSQTGAARSLWRIEEWGGGDLIICEGELDSVSFAAAGIFATSVPNGAPASRVEDLDSQKFSYLWDSKETLKRADRIILAVDADAPGSLLAEEIARRVGKARCWRAVYPASCKDANDVLVQFGADGLRNVLEDATPWPVSGLRNVSEYRAAAMDLYLSGMDRGVGVGIPSFDALYKTNPQSLTIITGIPGSGKSAFVTWLSVCLAKQSGWNCAVFSAECASEIHLLQLAAVYMGKPFDGRGKMTAVELEEAMNWISTRFVFIDESESSVASILERAQASVLRNGVRLLIVDPYNFLSRAEDGVGAINETLVALKTFCVEHSIACWLVAHPTKMHRDNSGEMPVPGLYDCSGSAGFANSSDAFLSIARVASGKTLVRNSKARYPWIGKLGDVILDFDYRTGSFTGRNDEQDDDTFDGFDIL